MTEFVQTQSIYKYNTASEVSQEMIIKLLPGNPCNAALVSFSREEFFKLGLSESEIETVTKFARLNRYEAVQYVNNIIRNKAV